MTRLVSFIVSILFCVNLFAQSIQIYQIKNLNTQTIEIGGKRLKVGDRFKDSEKIKWTSDDQVMEAIDLKNYEIHVFSATALRSKKANNVADYLVNINHASTRDLNSLNWNFTRSSNSGKFTNRRIALLIANTNYFHMPKLRNPMYDCNALSKKLLELGFDVYTTYDCESSQLRDAVVNFSKAADSYDLALFFYSGHGVQDDGQNYLIPVDRPLDDRSELDYCLKCEFVRNQLDKSKCANRIILFDACRSKKTWARDVSNAWGQMEGSLGTYISFSTKSGKTADDGGKSGNSPYTKALLKCIATPNRELTMVMGDVVRETAKNTNNQQEPSGSGYFRNELYLNPDLTSSNSQILIDSDLLVDQANKLCEEKKYTEAFTLYSQAAAQNNVRAIYNIGLCYENGEGVIQNHQKAAENYRIAAEKDLPIAQFALGMCYFDGIGVAQDYAKAIKWFQSAAEQGEAKAQAIIGSVYYYGEFGFKQNYIEAAKWFQKSAEQGNSSAQYYLGLCYEEGNGVPQDQEQAAKLYHKAAEQGEAMAQAVIGLVYYCGGLGLKQDYTEAAKWFQKSAEQDNLLAQDYLGICYLNGQGVTQNSKKGAEWLQKAAERGYADAQYNLGLCYSHGDGVQQDYMLAAQWIRKAAEQGNVYAQFTLGNAYFYGDTSVYQGVLELKQDYKKAFEWYRKAAEQGHAIALYSLGDCYFKGLGVAQDYAKAIKLYEMAAEQGYYLAPYSLGSIYYEGQGVKQDYAKAIKWFEIVSEQDNDLATFAQFNLGNCYEKGLGVKNNITKAVEWYKKAADRGYTPAKECLARLNL